MTDQELLEAAAKAMGEKVPPRFYPDGSAVFLSGQKWSPPTDDGDALWRAYYFTETGAWRGLRTLEADRWRAVAKVAAAQVEAERERIKAALIGMDDAVAGRHNYYAHAAWVLFERA